MFNHLDARSDVEDFEPDSREFAAQLRAGPLRAIIDRVVRSAAEATGMPYVVLGIRYDDYYEFISTYGMPLSHYSDRVPARLLEPKLFAREVEVADLQKQAHFTALSIAPVAKTWRYGGNCPVRLARNLSDDGVLALSCADRRYRDTGGRTIAILRQHADFISDLLWLGSQVPRANIATNPLIVVKAVLQAAVARFSLPVCIVDGNRAILGQSDAFVAAVRQLGGRTPQIGAPLEGAWLDAELRSVIDGALAEGQTKQWLRLTVSEPRQFVDVFPFSLPGLGSFAVVSLHDGSYQPALRGTGGDLDPVGPHGGGERSGPLAQFLDETLVHSQRLYRRNDTSYLGIRRWRTAIKAHQIAALRALKGDLSDAFVTSVARQLAAAVRAVYGSPEACVVIPVPCGHSGDGCLSKRLGDALAAELGIAVLDAFDPIDVAKGTSHPRTNGKRAPMVLRQRIEGPVILVDDVATSGSHIDEAAAALRRHAPSVWPVAWIAN